MDLITMKLLVHYLIYKKNQGGFKLSNLNQQFKPTIKIMFYIKL